MTIEQMLEEWHTVVNGKPVDVPDFNLRKLRNKLHREEFREARHELIGCAGVDKAKLAKELADMVYVVFGTAREFGIPLEAVVAAVHESNMSKIRGGMKLRDDGKVEKGPNYKAPDVQAVLDA